MSHDDQKTFTAADTSLALDRQPDAWLLVYHRDGCKMVGLQEATPVVVGRAAPADVPIRDGSLSRQHARFTLERGAVWVEDLGSTNGTRLKGRRIRGRTRVREHDEVKLGGVTVGLHFRGSGEEPVLEQRLDSHDQLMAKLENEVVRAHTFGRGFAVLMVRSLEGESAHVGRWDSRVRALLRPVDSMALYGPESILVCQVESGLPQAVALAEAIVKERKRREPRLGCGVAAFPDHAASAEELLETVRQLAQRAGSRAPVQVQVGGAAAPSLKAGTPPLVVANPRMQQLFETARRVADAALPVLIVGETGTGKEVLARLIHESSGRSKRPLCCINCGAITESLVESALFGHERGAFTGAEQRAKGIFEEADSGSVLLDEIGELSASAQAALLRVIETKKVARVGSSVEFPVDVRVLAATHRDLEQMCNAGQFRWDLFYRLNTLVLVIPPLRERVEEILPFAERFMHEACQLNQRRVRRINPEAQRLLQAYDWPGNVRELRNVIERAVVIAQDETLTVEDLSERVRRAAPAPSSEAAPEAEGWDIKERVRRYEADLLLEALKRNNWNQTKTAAALKMPLRTLVNKMQVLGLRKRYDAKS